MIEWIYFTIGAILGMALGVYSSIMDKKEIKNND